MKTWISAISLVLMLGALPAMASESTFERTLSVSGTVTLHVSTGSGFIHIKAGSDSQVHIFGRVKTNGFGGSEERVREIAAHPPIEQTGSIVRVGENLGGLHNISIEYEITAPAKSYLEASSGSGDVDDDGVGMNARLNTGSGNIRAKGLKESFTVGTGSGDIYADQVGSGDVKATTGSGNIELRNLSGGVRAHTGSGDIKFDREMLTQGSNEKHHLSGKVNGGGPMVKVETGSGDIRIH